MQTGHQVFLQVPWKIKVLIIKLKTTVAYREHVLQYMIILN